MKVLIPSPLLSYTGRAWVDAEGATLGEVLADLDRRYPGIRFFVNGDQMFDLQRALRATDEVCIVQALSGG